jgi:transcriptional regulator with XRE-family HTH domain
VDTAVLGFGPLLRHWRQHRGLTQMTLALGAEVSPRHLSWLESGKSMPSRAMVLRLADRLDVPLRERNGWLRAAGYAPLYRDRPLEGMALQSVQTLLDAHEPNPALAVDRHWNLVAANRMLPLLLRGVGPALLTQPMNVLRVALDPRGLGPRILNLPAWRGPVLSRLRRQAQVSGDAVLLSLHEELLALGPVTEDARFDDAVALPLQLQTEAGLLSFVSTITVFGAPHDIQLAELALETFLPADAATAQALRQLHAAIT